jgi:uncharacterized protein YbbC (DUF1343 family)
LALGLEVCLDRPPRILQYARIGLVANQASVDGRFRHAHELLAERFPGRLAALFGPQHGLWSEQQDNMVETPHAVHPRLRIPVHSLYAERRKPTPAMLAGLDALVVDLQDVGTRVYTYVWTLSYCLEACAEQGIPLVVLDRPNPLGGQVVEGPTLEPAFASFVGRAPIPMRHALTIGELALWLRAHFSLDVELEVVPMRGWQRAMLWPDLGRAWVPPSPNLPRFEGALVYPGQVLLEGTRLSEGRGTTTPFEACGAPFVDPEALRDALEEAGVRDFVARPVRFEPTFQKHRGRSCGGVFLHALDPREVRPYRASVALLAAVRRLWPDGFEWLPPPYEYETEQMPIDILSGGDRLRRSIDAGRAERELDGLCAADVAGWTEEVRRHLLYGREAPAPLRP